MTSSNTFEWVIGIVNTEEKYLTAENYGNKISAGGAALRQKQRWTVEFQDDESIFIRSYARNYISVDRLGKVTCEAKTRGEDEKFILEYANDGSARWAFRSWKYKYFLSGTGDQINCLAKRASEADLSLWYTPFAMHPQVTLFSMLGKKYAIADSDQVRLIGVKAWGPKALFTMEFTCGKYRFKTANNRYLCKDGSLVDTRDDDTLFGIEIHLSEDKTLKGLAFKDNDDRYLSVTGPSGILKANYKVLRKEEFFRLQESHPQVIIVGSGGKTASVGMEVMLKKITQAPTKSEIFQLEYEIGSRKWYIETYDGTFWGLAKDGRIEASTNAVSDKNMFEIIWLSNGRASIKGSNGKRLVSKGTGNLAASLPEDAEDDGFQIRVLNRPVIVFRSEFGFIGIKTVPGSNKDEYICTKAYPSVIVLDQLNDGRYSLKSENGKYWCLNLQVGGNPTVKAESSDPVPFVLEFRDTSLMTILAPNGRYMMCDKVGHFHAIATEPGPQCMLYY